MEVDKISFYPLLLDILTDISEAHFVAFDLELSGVPLKQTPTEPGRQTLQDRYSRIKAAAERYHILQIGMTCVQQDIEDAKYVLKPYNFDLSPLIDEARLDMERDFTFNSDAVQFLLRSGFNMSRPMATGVPYLSRAEAREARDNHAKRQDKSALADVHLKPTDVESAAFLDRVRVEINKWLPLKEIDAPEHLNISNSRPSGDAEADRVEDLPVDMSRYEKRLVHQLVRAEYPELVTISKHGFVRIVRFDMEREERLATGRKRELFERINRQKGFRWVIEALLGSDLSELDLQECARDPATGQSISIDVAEMKAQFHRAHALMRHNPRVIVGHNCFLDLVYIYRTFIGHLPDRVEEFQHKIHALWPNIVDTKYMSTHNCGDISPISSLEQIAQQLELQAIPKLEVDPQHKKYNGASVLHEAGFDSFLTAQIAVRLSHKLEREGSFVQSSESEALNGFGNPNLTSDNMSAHRDEQSEPNGISGVDIAQAEDMDDSSSISTLVPETDGFTPSQVGAKWKRRGDPSIPANDAHDPFVYDPTNLQHRYVDVARDFGFEGGMPGFGSDFWRVYGNKLRVFGTEEGVCVLDGTERSESHGETSLND